MERFVSKAFAGFVFPSIICFVLAFVVPFAWGVVLSFCEFSSLVDIRFVGLLNYIKAFTVDSFFLESFFFTLGIAVVSLLLVNIIAFSLA